MKKILSILIITTIFNCRINESVGKVVEPEINYKELAGSYYLKGTNYIPNDSVIVVLSYNNLKVNEDQTFIHTYGNCCMGPVELNGTLEDGWLFYIVYTNDCGITRGTYTYSNDTLTLNYHETGGGCSREHEEIWIKEEKDSVIVPILVN